VILDVKKETTESILAEGTTPVEQNAPAIATTGQLGPVSSVLATGARLC
jgi:hypothetical protein